MYRTAAALTVLNLGLATGLLIAGQSGNQENQPFAHSAYIPANSDLGSIRFENVKAVEVSPPIVAGTDSSYCDQLAFREPGGSMYCAGGKTVASVKAYRLTYSYQGQPLASDESSDRRFTFDVYFRPNEVAGSIREGLAFKKRNRAETAAYFTVKTERDAQQRPEVDEARSHFCPGRHVDGAWVKNNQACQDEIIYKSGAGHSEFVKVTVSSVSTQVVASK